MSLYSPLLSEKCNSDINDIKTLYLEAKINLPNLETSFEDAANFHNQLVVNKINFIKKDIPELKKEIIETNKKIQEKIAQKKHLENAQKKTGSLAEYEELVSKIKPLYENKGALDKEFENIKKYEKILSECSEKIIAVIKSLDEINKQLQEKLKIFNNYFSEYSKRFYDETYYISASFSEEYNCYKFKLENLDNNAGTGKLKGIMSAYDLAYISYIQAEGLRAPKFILHDRIEDMHNNQLKSII